LTINAGGATTFNVNCDSIPTFLNGGSSADSFNVNSNVVALLSMVAPAMMPLSSTGTALASPFNCGDDQDSFTINGQQWFIDGQWKCGC